MKEIKTRRRVLSLLVVAVLLIGTAFVGAFTASAAETTNVAKIGNTEYATLQAAMDACVAGDNTITLLNDSAEVFTFAQKSGVNITIDGDGHTFSGKITLNAGGGNLTFTDAKLQPANSQTIYLNASTAPNITIDGCTLVGNGAGAIVHGQASATSNAVVVKNCTASKLQYIVSSRQTGMKSLLIENVTATEMTYLARPLKCPSVTIKNVTAQVVIGVDIKNDAAGGKLVLENVNFDLVKYNGSYLDPVSGGGAGKSWTVEVKGECTFTKDGVPYEGNEWFSGNAGYNITLAEGAVVNPDPFAGKVAKIGETGYATLQEALAAANAGDTVVVLLADITEDVTVSKAVTIDGNGKTYTGMMTLKADTTIKNVNFDGKGYNGYAIVTRGAHYVTVEDCTAKNYGYGFIQLASATVLTTVKNVTVSDMNYGVKVDYSGAVVLENVDMTAKVAAVLNSNYGEKTITIKNSKLNILGTWTRNNTLKTAYVFEGENTVGQFIVDEAIDTFKLANGATLTAPNTVTVVTNVEGYEVAYENGAYVIVEEANYVAKIGETGYATLQEAIDAAKAAGDATVELLADVTLGEKLTITGNVTITGAYTITRADNYTGTFFEVKSGAILTLDGGLTIDGGNEYAFDKDAYMADAESRVNVPKTDSAKWFTPEEGAPIATAFMFTTTGGTINFNKVTVQNNYSTNNGVVSAGANSTITFTGAKITHIACTQNSGVVANISGANINVTVNEGTVIDGNHVGGNHGIFKVYSGATLTMNGGVIKNTTGWNSNGTVVGIYWGSFYMKGGEICSNSSVNGPSNGRNAAIYGHSGHTFVMTGGTICHNAGGYAGLDAPYDNGKTEIHGGSIVNNVSFSGNSRPDVNGSSAMVITGGTFTQDVSQWCAEGFKVSLLPDGTYGVVEDPAYGKAAQIGDVYYDTFAEAYAALQAGDTLILHADLTLSDILVIDKAITLDLNGKKLTGTIKLDKDAVLTAPEGLDVTTDLAGYTVKYANGAYTAVANIVKIGEVTYASLADALAAANAGDTLTFLADITEDVTVNKAVTIDGANFTYTGKMTLKADATIKNVNFDGKGYNGYAIETRGANYVTVEDCTAKNYGYGFIQLASGTALTTVKNVTVSNMNYGVKVDYSNVVVLENVDITASVAAVLNSNYGEKTITIRNSKLNILGTWTRNNTTKTTYVFEGENTVGKFIVDDAIDTFKLAKDATLTAPEGITATTDVEGYEAAYVNGVYQLAEVKNYVAEVNGAQYESLAEALAAANAGDTVVLLADVTEDVTVSKAVTIDGAKFTYTGKMTLKADATIKNVNFDGNGYNGYAIETRGAHYVTVEDCTATNYGYGFIQLASATVLTTVKNVTIENVAYGVKVDYSNAVVLENVDITASVAAVLNSNYGEKTITIRNSKLNILGTWTRNNTLKTAYVFEGANTIEKFIVDEAIDTFKLAEGATLTAPNTVTVVTDVENNVTVYEDGKYSLVNYMVVIKSSNLLIGNTIGIYFNVDTDTLVKDLPYVAVITNAKGDVVEIERELWADGKILFTGLAAKQMADEFTITIMLNGKKASEPKTESVQSYVARGLANNIFDEPTLKLLAATLNYGAAAQFSFGYNTTNYANSVLPEDLIDKSVTDLDEEKDTTIDFTYEAEDSCDDVYYGASLNLNENITFNFKFFATVGAASYAEVTFVDVNGNKVTAKELKADKTKNVNGVELYVVKFDAFLVQDAAQLFTCVLYDAEGNELATVKDGMLNYCARAINGLASMADYANAKFQMPFYKALAKYLTEVNNYATTKEVDFDAE